MYFHTNDTKLWTKRWTPDLIFTGVSLRCQAAMEDSLVQVRELQRQLQRQRKEKEELEERNEELEALLGETQNASREERHRHDGEVEGLHRRVMSSTNQSVISLGFIYF